MNTEKTSLEQVGFWALLGPFIMLITLTVLLLNPFQHSFLIPGIALISFPLCWKWKIRGLSVVLALIGSLLLYQLWTTPSERIFWDLLLDAAAALTFTITALCSQEVDDLIGPLQEGSLLWKHHLQEANERVQMLEMKVEEQISVEEAKAKFLQQQLDEAAASLHASEAAASALREKSAAISAQNETLLRELFQKRHECDKLLQQMQRREIANDTEAPQLETVPQAAGKSKSKPSKTNNWANTILSRWSEPHDPSQ